MRDSCSLLGRSMTSFGEHPYFIAYYNLLY